MEESSFSKRALLLMVCVCELLERTEAFAPRGGGGGGEDQGSRIRGLWRLHMKEVQSKGKAAPAHPSRGVAKKHFLYCRVGIGFHLQILPNGSVGGVHIPTEHCNMRVFAMKHGVVGIRGVTAGLYLCMQADGVVYGAEHFSDDCLFKENLEENFYTTYSSLPHPGLYLALSHKGEVKKGTGVSRHQACTHFLPRRVH
ncbi:Fibroblast growth factor 4 [Merluccius polli]|uniref:Fibroblast growth factor n=1 Tax=Merluccius polli TaxID=89951 RepID=A0AA47M9C8_MERPO|nr:Fibroblast growth factor 4 [Merluccius polli]